MTGFGFSLAKNTSLREEKDGYYLISHLPVKMLRLNRSFFLLLKHIQSGGELFEFIDQDPDLVKADVLILLLSLVAKGYLELKRIAEIGDFPSVSIIIPVRDQADDLIECLHSLTGLDYPEDRKEIIVVDDGSMIKVSGVISPLTTLSPRSSHRRHSGLSGCRLHSNEALVKGDYSIFSGVTDRSRGRLCGRLPQSRHDRSIRGCGFSP